MRGTEGREAEDNRDHQFAHLSSDSPPGSDSDITGSASAEAQSLYFPSEDERELSEEQIADSDVTDAEVTSASAPSGGDTELEILTDEAAVVCVKKAVAEDSQPDLSPPAAGESFPHAVVPTAPRITHNGTASRSGSITTQPPTFIFSHTDSPPQPVALPAAPASDTRGNEAFFAAIHSGNWAYFMRCLYKDSTLISAVDLEGRTALHILCGLDSRLLPTACAIVEVLLELKADPNRRDDRRLTPLMLACIKQSWDIVLLLLAAGGDLNIPCRMVPEVEHCLRSLPLFDASLLEEGRFAASDLVPVDIAPVIFAAIDRPQSTFCRDDHVRCMRCFRMFTQQEFPFHVYEKHDCANCRRIVCEYCMDSSASYAKCICSVLQEKIQSGVGKLCKSCYSP
jgi:hypothetical protein